MPRKEKPHFMKKTKNSNKDKHEAPESSNEYLAAGVDLEEAGEKHRAGDAPKALRFFLRATDTYATGLQHFPQSFDLAYNKARLEYEVAQQTRMREQLSIPFLDLLQTTLHSHRTALKIQQDSPDLLFNTAQVLTSIAEAMTGGSKATEEESDSALHQLQEALELFQRCLDLQESKYTQAQEEIAQRVKGSWASSGETEPVRSSSTVSNASEDEVWALVEEPITKETLLDTVVAQMNTLTSLCSLGSSRNSGLAWVEDYYHTALQSKINLYLEGTSAQYDVVLAEARLVSAISDAAFRAGSLDLLNYEGKLRDAFNRLDLESTHDAQGLCARADAELMFVTTLKASLAKAPNEDLPRAAKLCWIHITKALENLTAASRIPGIHNLPHIHLRRGDCEMLRLNLSEPPLSYALALNSTPTLLKNAGVYYGSASLVGKQSQTYEEEQKEAEVKEAMVLALADDVQKLAELLIKFERNYVQAIVEDMQDEGLLGGTMLDRLARLLP